MADTFTPNYNFTLPEVGASINTWPGKLNANFTAIDLAIFGLLAKAGGTMTGPLALAAGTVGAPSLTLGDTDTGLYSTGAGNVSVTVNGARVVSFDPGVATFTTLAYTGELNGFVAAVQHFSQRPYQTDANNGGLDVYTRGGGTIAFRFRIDEAGRVGIKTNAPAADLSINGNVVQNVSNLAGGTAISCALSNYFYKTATTTTTFTFTNVPAATNYFEFLLELTNGGAFTVNWPAAVKWPLGVAPALTAAGVDHLSFFTRDGGTTWYGALVRKGSA